MLLAPPAPAAQLLMGRGEGMGTLLLAPQAPAATHINLFASQHSTSLQNRTHLGPAAQRGELGVEADLDARAGRGLRWQRVEHLVHRGLAPLQRLGLRGCCRNTFIRLPPLGRMRSDLCLPEGREKHGSTEDGMGSTPGQHSPRCTQDLGGGSALHSV